MTDLFEVGTTGPLQAYDNGGVVIDSSKVMTYNKSTGQPLGVVGTDYNIMQPQECYDLVEKTCGAVDNVHWDGKTMIMQGRMNSMLLPGDDQVDNMFTIVNSFNGSSALHGMGISFRMFCMNQLRMAFTQSRQNGMRMSIRHNGDWDAKVKTFQDAFDTTMEGRFQFNRQVSTLVERKVTKADIEELWKAVAPKVVGLTPENIKEEAGQLKVLGFLNTAMATYEEEKDLGCPDSMWLAANAVTKFVQHSVAKRGRKADSERRFVDNTIGNKSKISSYVMKTALSMV
jgi:hypothetical protein